MDVQTVRVSKSISKRDANKIVKELKYKVTPPAINNPQYKNFHSYRQRDPSKFIKSSFRTKQINKDVFIILGKLKGKKY
jgi:hypothetical protein